MAVDVAGHRALLLLVAAALAAAVAVSADGTKPSILTPVAHTPIGAFEGEKPAADVMDEKEAAAIGSPIGTTMTEPKPQPTPEAGGAAAAAAGGQAPAASAAYSLAVEVARFGAVAAVAAVAF